MTEKDQAIRDLLREIDLSAHGWMTVDHWDADLCAIGFARVGNPRRLVYVSTFNKNKGLYDYECEEAGNGSDEVFRTLTTGTDVDLSALVSAAEQHLK